MSKKFRFWTFQNARGNFLIPSELWERIHWSWRKPKKKSNFFWIRVISRLTSFKGRAQTTCHKRFFLDQKKPLIFRIWISVYPIWAVGTIRIAKNRSNTRNKPILEEKKAFPTDYKSPEVHFSEICIFDSARAVASCLSLPFNGKYW